jgi:hypothetical protein
MTRCPDTITCLWIQSDLDEFSTVCIKSWIRLGYHVDLYTYSTSFMNNISISHLHIKDANKILSIPIDDTTHKPFLADEFRFNLFKQNKEGDRDKLIWCDTDILLLRTIPTKSNYVSSQYTQQTGAFKCRKKIVPNIGVMCLDGREDIDYNKILNCKKKPKAFQSKYLKEYEKQVPPDLIMHPEAFCPIHWAWAKELFTCKFFKNQFKYGIAQKQIEDILPDENILGVHLWRQIYHKKKLEINDSSVYRQFLNHLEL